VVEAELRTEDDGRSKGFGTVAYESILEAMHAVAAFNEQELFGRPMRVRIYVPDDARKQLRDRERDLERLDLDPRRVRLPDGLRSVGPGLTALANALNKSAPAPEPFAPVSDLLASSMLQSRQQQAAAPTASPFQNAPVYGGGGGQNYSNAPGGYNSGGGSLGSSGYGAAQGLQSNNSAGSYNYGQTPTQQPPPPPSHQPYSNYNAGGQMAPSGAGSSASGFYGGGQAPQSQYGTQQQPQPQQQQQQQSQQQQSQSSWYSQQPTYGGSIGGSAGAGSVAGAGGTKFVGQQSPSAQQPYGQNPSNNYAANAFPTAANDQKYTPPTGYDGFNRGSTGFR
jgi:RNA recognition motif-containing protein